MIIRATQRKMISRAVVEETGRIKGAQLRRILGPAERCERPKRRAKPGVEDIVLLAQLSSTFAAALGRTLGDNRLLAGIAVPDWDSVTPPQLARYAPGTNLSHPVEIDPFPLGRDDPHPIALNHFDRRLGKLLHATEPLQGDARLDPLSGAMGEGNRVKVGALGPNHSLLAQRRHDRTLGLADRQPGEAPSLLGQTSVGADHNDLSQSVPAPDLKIIGVMTGGDLQGAGAELGVDIGVRDNRQSPPDQRQQAVVAEEIGVARVLRVDGNRGVGEHRLRAHRGDAQHTV